MRVWGMGGQGGREELEEGGGLRGGVLEKGGEGEGVLEMGDRVRRCWGWGE